jgi:proteasome lid subunit RPN8/RPN11
MMIGKRRADSAADESFTPVGVVDEPIQRKPRHLARAGYVVYGEATGFEVAIPEFIVERAMILGKQAAPREWYGLLVGRVYEDDDGHHVVILGVVPDPEAEASFGFVRTSFDSEMRTRLSARLLYPDCVPVGWMHGHIRYGATYSRTDFKNQATWTQPYSVGIVVDPFSEPSLGVYRGPEGEMLKAVDSEVTIPEMFKPMTESKSTPAVTTRPTTVHSARHAGLNMTVPLVVLAALVMAVLWGSTARLDERTVHLERRLSELEHVRGEIQSSQTAAVILDQGEMCNVAHHDRVESALMCAEP